MASWVRTITSPFKKLFNPPKEKKAQKGHNSPGVDLHGEVMACGYEDVHVMWSILDKSKPGLCDVNS